MPEKYYHTKESVEEYIKLAEGHNGLGLIKELQKFVPAGAKILEIGTGPGTDWEILDKFYQVYGSDNSLEFLKKLRARLPKNKFLELDAVTLETNMLFDGIYSNKVLHHLTDEGLQESVKKQHGILNAHGTICHSFWKGDGDETFKGMFVNYHTDKGIESFFNPYFKTLLIKSYKEFETGDSILYIGKRRG